MHSITSLLALLVLILVGSPARSGVYSWIDKSGNVHFADTPPAESMQSNALSPVTTIMETQQYAVTLFKVVEADDPGIVGTYVPTYSALNGLPGYELKQEPRRALQSKVPQLFATTSEGRWQWTIRTGYSSYDSNIVAEGSTPDKVDSWRKSGSDVNLSIIRQDMETPRKLFDHMYHYNLNKNSPGLPDWQKQAYRVSGHPDLALNGEYYPVTWSSETPRYRTDWNTCLVLRTIGSSWQWSLGKCEMLSYSSSRVPAQTLPQQVQLWMRHAGMQIMSFTVEQIAK